MQKPCSAFIHQAASEPGSSTNTTSRRTGGETHRFEVAIFMPFKRLRKPSRSRCESAGIFNERNVLQHFDVIQSVDVENVHGGNEEVNL